MVQKNPKRKESIDFEKFNENEALIQMKLDIDFFLAALVKMKMVDNFNHTFPSGLTLFAEFFFSHHELIYRNQEVPNNIYTEFLKWLSRKNDIK